MVAGDVLTVPGYDVRATIAYAETGGYVRVLCNESTHFLVVVSPGPDDDEAQLEEAFPYFAMQSDKRRDDRDPSVGVYCRALHRAVEIASTR